MFETFTSNLLVTLYNAAQDQLGRESDAHVKKFSDKATAVKRLEKAQAELAAMYGAAEPRGDGTWSLDKKPVSNGRIASTLDLTLTVVTQCDNPKRKGSRAYDTFALYSSGTTGEAFVKEMEARGYTRKLALSTLHWDLDHGFIKLEKKA